MKGKMKKLFALALAAIMVLAMGITVSAEGTGTITMKNATPNTKYIAFKLFSANPAELAEGATTTDQVAYTATAAQKDWFDGFDDANPFEFTLTTNSDVFNVSVKKGKTDADVIAFLNGLYTSKEENGSTTYTFANGFEALYRGVEVTADALGNLSFANVPYGYYLITSGLGATVTVTSTNPNANVIDKNISKPSMGNKVIKKSDGTTATVDSVNYGDVINFEVDVTSSNYDGAKLVTKYEITDTLDTGLSYVKNADGNLKVEVKVGDATLGADKYTVAYDASSPKTFKITIPWASGTIDKDGNVDASTVQTPYAQGAKILVTYSATVDNDAALGTALKNEATFRYYLNNLTQPENPAEPTKKTETFTYGFDLVKTNKLNEILSGAEFSLYPAEDSNDAIVFVAEKNATGVITGYHKASAAEIVDSTVVKTTTLIAGNVKIKGLAGGVKTTATDAEGNTTITTVVGSKSYWLEETKAPAGYNALTERKEVSIDGNKYAVVNGNNYTSGGVEVENAAGAQLPSTGGIGTTIFYVVGSILMLAAVVLFVTKKRSAER